MQTEDMHLAHQDPVSRRLIQMIYAPCAYISGILAGRGFELRR
jgi:hypothetical protein